MRYFICSDVHSFYDEFIKALDDKDFNAKKDKLIVCGDLFDRGYYSVECYDFVTSLKDNFIYVRGNHEDLLNKCVMNIISEQSINRAHISNGTISTVAQFCGEETIVPFIESRRTDSIKQKTYESMKEVLDFINKKSVNYFEINDMIFTHGWIPTVYEDKLEVAPRNMWNDSEDFDCTPFWETARWENGMREWFKGAKVEGKTVVCGHWHCSYGHSVIDKKCSEFGKDAIFTPYINDGIIAIDSCVTHSGFLNCIVYDTKTRQITI